MIFCGRSSYEKESVLRTKHHEAEKTYQEKKTEQSKLNLKNQSTLKIGTKLSSKTSAIFFKCLRSIKKEKT